MKRKIIILSVLFIACIVKLTSEEPSGWKEFKFGMSYSQVQKILKESSYFTDFNAELYDNYYGPTAIKNIYIGNLKCKVICLFYTGKPYDKISEIRVKEIETLELKRIVLEPEKEEDKTEENYFFLYNQLLIKYGKPQIDKRDSLSYLKTSHNSIWVFSSMLIDLEFHDYTSWKTLSITYKLKESIDL